MPATLDSICQSLAQIAPLKLAESWDNVGLLVGDRARSIEKAITCLTVTPSVVAEAIERNVGLIVTHHPLPFHPLKRITSDSITGQMLWQLIGAQVAVYSAHTAFDSAAQGINQTWAESMGLESIRPIVDPTPENEWGSGRFGLLPAPMPARDVIRWCGAFASSDPAGLAPRGVGALDQMVRKVGFACGSGGSFLADSHRRGCELLITGEAPFHSCLEAESLGMAMGLLGHYQSERFAMEILAKRLIEQFPELSIWPSEGEADPIAVV